MGKKKTAKAALAVATAGAYEQGREDGYDVGYETGLLDHGGRIRKEGYDHGYRDAIEAIARGEAEALKDVAAHRELLRICAEIAAMNPEKENA